jgi:hypothetical protein
MIFILSLFACIPAKTVKFQPVEGVICERRNGVTICTVSGSVGCSPVSLTDKP